MTVTSKAQAQGGIARILASRGPGAGATRRVPAEFLRDEAAPAPVFDRAANDLRILELLPALRASLAARGCGAEVRAYSSDLRAELEYQCAVKQLLMDRARPEGASLLTETEMDDLVVACRGGISAERFARWIREQDLEAAS